MCQYCRTFFCCLLDRPFCFHSYTSASLKSEAPIFVYRYGPSGRSTSLWWPTCYSICCASCVGSRTLQHWPCFCRLICDPYQDPVQEHAYSSMMPRSWWYSICHCNSHYWAIAVLLTCETRMHMVQSDAYDPIVSAHNTIGTQSVIFLANIMSSASWP